MTDWVPGILEEYAPHADPPLQALVDDWALTVHGDPAPQGSKVWRPNGSMGDASKKTKPWREAIVGEILRQGMVYGITHPVSVRVTFMYRRPKAHYLKAGLRPDAPSYKASTPDLDKLCRSTLDGLVQAGMLADDAIVVSLMAQKRYGDWQGAYISVNLAT
jgi:crossover junction endodeoxyribonuclease RusA